ncbi:hypothetical protein [Alkalibacillus haloalkaliphilus]|uniref:hypothetical protein n=1 Tax=Alkalibacillus haloalkaliphilus TaxID=94136 RepID=UPI0029366CDA|nr:hypothetical protein [Alkalibacillus haloalkaliphilus]MDV2582469.1 hypothetical protein [Alkalibacillus haloalkaliphilus]
MKYDSRAYLHGHKDIIRVKHKTEQYENRGSSFDVTKPLNVQDIIQLFEYEEMSLEEVSFNSKHIHLRNTLLNGFKTSKPFEESLEYKRVHHCNKPKQQVTILLIDLSKSMRKPKYLSIINQTIKENQNILFHREQIIDLKTEQIKLDDFQGGTSIVKPLLTLLQAEQLMNGKFNIVHLTDGDVPTKEWEEACNIINELEGNYEFQLLKTFKNESIRKRVLEENDIKYTLLAHNIGE